MNPKLLVCSPSHAVCSKLIFQIKENNYFKFLHLCLKKNKKPREKNQGPVQALAIADAILKMF
jgi:hypothetical protein